MGILKKIVKGFTVTPNRIINREDISLRAKGVWTYLNSKPEGWKFSIVRISKESKDGRDSVRCAVKELEKNGFLVRKARINKKGQFDGYTYIIYDEPDVGNIVVDYTVVGKSVNGEPVHLSNKDISNKELSNNNKASVDLFGEQINAVAFLPEDIIDYLNLKLQGKNPKKRGFGKIDSNYTHIKARLKDKKIKYKLEDFKAVIDFKIYEWFGKEKTEKWIRPKTLFGENFDSYLTQASEAKTKENKNWGNKNFVDSETTNDDLL